MRYFDNGNKIRQDACALETRDRENQSRIEYLTYNYYNVDGTCAEVEQKVKSLANEYPNMRFRVGYGVASSCTIENDSRIRLGSDLTHGPERQILNSRSFVAAPYFGRGQAIPNLESVLLNGIDTLSEKDCHKIAETNFPVFQPLSPCIESYVKGASTVIDNDTRIGKPSKDIFMAQRKSACK